MRAVVAARPGISKNELATTLGVAWYTVQHHVRVLARRGEIVVDETGWSHDIFPADIPTEYRPYLKALRDENKARVLEALFDGAEVGVPQLSERLGLSRKVVRTHLTRLAEQGIAERVGRARGRYRLGARAGELEHLLRHGAHGIRAEDLNG